MDTTIRIIPTITIVKKHGNEYHAVVGIRLVIQEPKKKYPKVKSTNMAFVIRFMMQR